MSKYNFKVKTADQYGAGTDSNIFITLYGSKGISNEIRINGHIKGNAFERNQLDKFSINYNEDFGDIYKINLRSDAMYAGADWMCSYFVVKKENSKNESTFKYNKWVDNKKMKELLVTSGYALDIPKATIKYEEILGATHNIPANVEMMIKCTTKWSYEVNYSKVEIIENTTKASVDVSYSAVKASVENMFKYGIERQIGAKLSSEETLEIECKVPVSATPRKLQETWSETDYYFEVLNGEQMYNFEIPKKRTFTGFKEIY